MLLQYDNFSQYEMISCMLLKPMATILIYLCVMLHCQFMCLCMYLTNSMPPTVYGQLLWYKETTNLFYLLRRPYLGIGIGVS